MLLSGYAADITTPETVAKPMTGLEDILNVKSHEWKDRRRST